MPRRPIQENVRIKGDYPFFLAVWRIVTRLFPRNREQLLTLSWLMYG